MNRSSLAVRRWLSILLVGVLGVVGLVAVQPAVADIAPVDPSLPATVTADGLPTVQIDGVVWSQVVVGDTVYAAGSFQTARPAGAPEGVGTVVRNNVLAYDIATGELEASFAPDLNGQAVTITASPDGSRIYVGGDFTQVNGQNRNRVAAFSTATGQLVAGFAPSVDARVRSIVATDEVVYLGGSFSRISGLSRTRLGAVAAVDGAVLNWAPSAEDRQVDALVMSPSGAKLIVAGRFTALNGAEAYGMGAVDPVTGEVLPWAATDVVRNAGEDAGIVSLSANNDLVFGTGFVFGQGGNLEGAFAADAESGDIHWVADCHGDTHSSFPMDGALYTAGHAHYCGNLGTGGFPQTDPWDFYRAIAFTLEPTGTLTPDIHGYPSFTGHPSPTLLNWFPYLDTGSVTGQGQGPWHVTGNGQYVVMGGEFENVNGQGQQGLVRFAYPQNAPKEQGPRLTWTNTNPRVSSLSAGSVRVSIPGNWDRDNATLTYRLYRDTTDAAPIYQEEVTARFWETTPVTYVDEGLEPGAEHRYRVTVTDSTGNQAVSEWVSITVAASGTQRYGFFLNDGWDAWADHVFRYGRFSDEVLIGDWDGNSTDTITMRRGNEFHVSNAQQGGDAEEVFRYGRPGDTILVGDWDANGTDTLAVRRGNEYHIKNTISGGEADVVIRYGRTYDQVMVGDWDANGTDTLAVRRGSEYHVKNTIAGGDADTAFHYGRAGDVVLAGDWDGDGYDTFAVRRGHVYHVKNSLTGGNADIVQSYGRDTDEVYVGDWNGDGIDTLGLRRAPAPG